MLNSNFLSCSIFFSIFNAGQIWAEEVTKVSKLLNYRIMKQEFKCHSFSKSILGNNYGANHSLCQYCLIKSENYYGKLRSVWLVVVPRSSMTVLQRCCLYTHSDKYEESVILSVVLTVPCQKTVRKYLVYSYDNFVNYS